MGKAAYGQGGSHRIPAHHFDQFCQHFLQRDAVQRVSGLGQTHRAQTLVVYTHDVIRFKFVRYGAVADAGDHGGHGGALLDEVFLADRVKKTLANGDFVEFDAVTGRVIGHAGLEKVKGSKTSLTPVVKRGRSVFAVDYYIPS